MCRYGETTYKDHYACFSCRKTFKKSYLVIQDMKSNKDADFSYSCPQCGREIKSMGLDFKSPKLNDLKQWQKIEILYQNGFTFHSCGCCGPGLRPAELNQVEEFLKGNLKKSEGEKLLELISKKKRATGK